MVPLAVGATASDHLEFLWRVVNLFPKVREVDSTASDHPEPVPVAFPVVLWVFGRQIRTQKDCPRFYWLLILILTRQVLWRAAQEREPAFAVVQQLLYPSFPHIQVEIVAVESDPLLFEC